LRKIIADSSNPAPILDPAKALGRIIVDPPKGTIDLTIYDGHSIAFHHDGSVDITAPIDSIKGFSLT